MDMQPLTLFPKSLWYGDETLFARPLAAVLNSRQNRYPTGDEGWVRNTLSAVAHACQDEKVLLSSFGMNTWELASWAAGEVLGPLVALVGVPETMEDAGIRRVLIETSRSFRLMPQQTLLIPYAEPVKSSPKAAWHARDRWILDHATRLYPVSIREGGFFNTALQETQYHAKLNNDFRTEYAPTKPEPMIQVARDEVAKLISKESWDFVVHWTRRSPGPWPGETANDYFRELVASKKEYHRSAWQSLMQILEENCIHGTAWRMPGGVELVSLSAAHPADMVALMVWRPRQVRPAYEPFGIGIRREALERVDGRAVKYLSLDEAKHYTAKERLFIQTVKPEGYDWSVEQEWRVVGDIALDGFAPEDVCLFVPDSLEEEQLLKVSPFRVIALRSGRE